MQWRSRNGKWLINNWRNNESNVNGGVNGWRKPKTQESSKPAHMKQLA